ncbi:MAG TPA: polysaccharide biosynthesis/export family protein [Draconibacterium sp.]|jgi:polysaccharide export outer membrane protein|nr:polysaccharide biosynthesis/export family protein [Draconibacterium sp.]
MKIFYRNMIPFLLLAIMFGSSCKAPTPLEEINYMYGINTNKTYLHGPVPDEYKIRPNDQLYIKVISDDPLNSAFLNLTGAQTANSVSGESMELITYLVDENENINYPQLGEIHVGGLMLEDVRDIIQKGVDKYLQSASVFVKLVNRNITVLGEVKAPGQQLMVKNKLTIFEALGTAGDLTDWGNRQNVKVLRELPEGKHIAELDLTSPNVIQSPYYYILPNDIVYVEHRDKVYGDKNVGYGQRLTIGLSVISTLLLIANLFLL